MQVLMPHVSCVVHEHELQSAIDQKYPEIFVLTPGGIFKRKTLMGNRHLTYKVDSIPRAVSTIKEEINFLPAGKIPAKFLNEIIEFFRQVIAKKNAPLEAMAFVLWNEKDGYHIAVPNQSISGASVTYDRKEFLKKGDIIVLDIHSHNNMPAFFSGTDDSDDKLGIYYSGVVGRMNESIPMTVWRFNIQDIKKEASMYDIFDIPKPEVSINPSWIDRVDVKKPVVSGLPMRGWGGGHYYQGQGDLLDPWEHGGYGGADGDYSFNPRSGTYERSAIITAQRGVIAHALENLEPDPVGGPVSDVGLDDYYISMYGKEIVDSKEQIEIYMQDLQGCDDLLSDLIQQMFEAMSAQGQQQIMTHGFR